MQQKVTDSCLFSKFLHYLTPSSIESVIAKSSPRKKKSADSIPVIQAPSAIHQRSNKLITERRKTENEICFVFYSTEAANSRGWTMPNCYLRHLITRIAEHGEGLPFPKRKLPVQYVIQNAEDTTL